MYPHVWSVLHRHTSTVLYVLLKPPEKLDSATDRGRLTTRESSQEWNEPGRRLAEGHVRLVVLELCCEPGSALSAVCSGKRKVAYFGVTKKDRSFEAEYVPIDPRDPQGV